MTWPLPPLWDLSISELVRWSQQLGALRAATHADGLLARAKAWLDTDEGREGLPEHLDWTCTRLHLSWRDGGPAVDIRAQWTAPMPQTSLSMNMETEGVFMDGLDIGCSDILRQVSACYPWDKLTAATPVRALAKVQKSWLPVPHPMVNLDGADLMQLGAQANAWRKNVLAVLGYRVLSALPPDTEIHANPIGPVPAGFTEHRLQRVHLRSTPALTDPLKGQLFDWMTQMRNLLREDQDDQRTWSDVGRWLKVHPPSSGVRIAYIWKRDQLRDFVDLLPPSLRVAYEANRLNEALPSATRMTPRAARI